VLENDDRSQQYTQINGFNNVVIMNDCNDFFIFCTHSNAIREATAKKAKLHYFTFIFFFNEISLLEIYQKFSPFILPVKWHNFNKRELAQCLQNWLNAYRTG
jgi:hypothetical protein